MCICHKSVTDIEVHMGKHISLAYRVIPDSIHIVPDAVYLNLIPGMIIRFQICSAAVFRNAAAVCLSLTGLGITHNKSGFHTGAFKKKIHGCGISAADRFPFYKRTVCVVFSFRSVVKSSVNTMVYYIVVYSKFLIEIRHSRLYNGREDLTDFGLQLKGLRLIFRNRLAAADSINHIA